MTRVPAGHLTVTDFAWFELPADVTASPMRPAGVFGGEQIAYALRYQLFGVPEPISAAVALTPTRFDNACTSLRTTLPASGVLTCAPEPIAFQPDGQYALPVLFGDLIARSADRLGSVGAAFTRAP